MIYRQLVLKQRLLQRFLLMLRCDAAAEIRGCIFLETEIGGIHIAGHRLGQAYGARGGYAVGFLQLNLRRTIDGTLY